MFKKAAVVFCFVLSGLFLLYLVMPGPTVIADFLPLSDSTKSSYEGDTIQVPNVASYFSDHYRTDVVAFYTEGYLNKTKFFFKPLRLNHPPEEAYTFIKDQTPSTYLEELTYPFRDSLFVNGYEPLDENGEARWRGASRIEYDGARYDTKVTLRYYPSKLSARLLLWLGVNASVIALIYLGRKVLTNG
jgi:hypothetical protein